MPHTTKAPKPLLQQSGSEMLDTVAGEKTTDAVMASGSDWVKAVSERRMPSRHTKAQTR
jgi:hypothetical protein